MSIPRQGEVWWAEAEDCAAAFDNLQPIRRAFLTSRLGTLDAVRRPELCRAAG